MNIEQVVYGTKGNETYLTLVMKKVAVNDRGQLENRPAIYKIYGTDGELLYVGESTSLRRRITKHFSNYRLTGKRFGEKDVSEIEYAYVDLDRYSRVIVEGILVAQYKPFYNCDDIKMTETLIGYPMDELKDILFYIRNTDYSNTAIAKGLGVKRGNVKNIRDNNVGNSVKLPAEFVPSVIISEEFANEFNSKRYTKLPKESFFEVRNLLDKGMSQRIISKKTGVSLRTVQRMKQLQYPSYIEWEQERIKAVS